MKTTAMLYTAVIVRGIIQVFLKSEEKGALSELLFAFAVTVGMCSMHRTL